MSDGFGVDFGQKVDLTASIRSILRNYPEGTAILKELVQNADDAGASKISFCLDKRQHGTALLAGPLLGQFQGSALLVYNDATFTEEDFKSIQRIGDSMKKTDESKSKIGRFGIGFNSVYHITELPSFVSASNVVLLDPQAQFLPNVNPANPGKMVNYLADPSILDRFQDQFAPYNAFGLNWTTPYRGTIFRFPLRTPAQAETSLLSKRSMSPADVHDLLMSLIREASAMLLFLKSVEAIEILEWEPGQSTPNVLFKTEIANITDALKRQRSFVGNAIRISNASSTGGKLSAGASLSATQGNTEIPVDFTLRILCATLSSECHEEHWEVCNQLGGQEANAIAANMDNVFLRLVPWAGVAACVRSTAEQHSIRIGLAYCFLPLPVQTGLPIMVNGFFELSSNRRDVWQEGVDMTGDGRTRAAWNVALMNDIIGPSYTRLLLRIKDVLGFSESYQSFWPTGTLAHPWEVVKTSMLRRAQKERLLYRQVHTLADPSARHQELWIPCCEAVVLPGGKSTLVYEDADMLSEVLMCVDAPFTNCNVNLRDLLIESRSCGHVADAKYVRSVLKASQYIPVKRLCAFLLKYCIADIGLSGVGELDGLSILPLITTDRGASDGDTNRIGTLRIFSMSQTQAIEALMAMGFSSSLALSALSKYNYNVDSAMDVLMDPSHRDHQTILKSSSVSMFILCMDTEDLRVFSKAEGILIDRNAIYPNELEFLNSKQFQLCSNVKRFEPYLTLDILRRILPPEYFDAFNISANAKGVQINENLNLNLSENDLKSFIKQFWELCQKRQEIVSSIAERVCVVPTRLGRLLSLSRLSYVVDPGGMPEGMLGILERLGLYTLSPELVPDSSSMPPVFWEYIYPSNRSGLLQALKCTIPQSQKTPTIDTSPFNSLGPRDRDELMAYLASCEAMRSLSDTDRDILKALPIYTCFQSNKSLDSSVRYFSLTISGTAAFQTLGDIDRLSMELFPTNFVRYRDSNELLLLRSLQIPVLQRHEYFRHYMVPNLPLSYLADPATATKDCLTMLHELPSILQMDKSFVNFLRDACFIPSTVAMHPTLRADPSDGLDDSKAVPALCMPRELYDPSDSELLALLPKNCFPVEEFHREDILVYLRNLGLRSTLDWPGILSCARDIADATTTEPSDALSKRQRGESLLKFLDRNANSLFIPPRPTTTGRRKSANSFSIKSLFFGARTSADSEVNSEEDGDMNFVDPKDYLLSLNSIAWVPVMTECTDYGLPWPSLGERNSIRALASPEATRPYADAWMCSASMSLCKTKIYSAHLLSALGWSSPLHHSVIATQLRDLSILYEKLHQDLRSLGTLVASESSIRFQELRERITALIPNLYQQLNAVAAGAEGKALLVYLSNVPWIWVGDAFVCANRVAYVSTINFAPYLYLVPQDLSVYNHLLNVFGVRHSFSSRDYIDVLQRMAMETGAFVPDGITAQQVKEGASFQPIGKPLSDEQLDLAVSLITLINADGTDTTGVSLKTADIYLPDQQAHLTLSSNLVIDDVPWLSGPEYMSIRSGLQFLHNNIANKFAVKLGIKSLRMLLVDRSVEQIFSVSDSTVEAFGQAESLTSRLKTILDMYPDGNPILSELIQNGDDAGASVIRILLDENSYESVSLLNSSMTPLQGPALLIGNDAQFAESDFRALAKIGQGSKLDKLSATGRFGLGFNSVYHLTDTPSIVSGGSLVIFDPHTNFVPGATLSQPGLRLRFGGSSMKNTFPDQFSPYEFFGCDMNSSYPGTLFRFPLRTASLARKSEISKRSYSVADVEALLENLSAQLSHHLLFLRSVSRIELYRCAVGQKEPQLIKSASATVGRIETINSQTLLSHFDKQRPAGEKVFSRDDFYASLKATRDADLPTSTFTVRIKVHDGNATVLEDVEYFVVSGLRGGTAKQSACDPANRHLKLVPFGAVAACISRLNGQDFSKVLPDSDDKSVVSLTRFPPIQGQAFCFLPLPVRTKLPVHVNAYFELSSNRRDIWKADDTVGDSRIRGLWNEALMKDVVAPLYAQLIENIKRIYFSDQTTADVEALRLLSLLPCPVPQDHSWQLICDALFPLLKPLEILWSRGKRMYLPLQSAILIPLTTCYGGSVSVDANKAVGLAIGDQVSAELNELERLLIEENLPIVAVPLHIYQTLYDSNCVKDQVSPEVVRRHFKSRGGNVPHQSIDFLEFLKTEEDSADSLNDSATQSIRIKKKNAAFLLSYCLGDLQVALCSSAAGDNDSDSPAALLYGLPLLPTEGGSKHAVLLSPTDPPLYLATELERKLLLSATDNIIARSDVIGQSLQQLFKNPNFISHFNILPLSPLDVLKLLRRALPSAWFWESTAVVDCSNTVTNEWLCEMWSYIIETKSAATFDCALPLLPVYVSGQKDGSYLLKRKAGVPLLHMMLRDNMSSTVMDCLGSLGLFIFNPTVLGGISFSHEISGLLCASTYRGFFDAILQVAEKAIQYSHGLWSAETKDSLRNYLLDIILPRCDTLSIREQEILRSLCIWRTTSGPDFITLENSTESETKDQTKSSTAELPPALFSLPHYSGVTDKLMNTGIFIRLREDSDRAMYRKLGMHELSGAIFYASHVIPHLLNNEASYDADLLEKISFDILSRLNVLETESKGFKLSLQQCSFVMNESNRFCRPSDLFDPSVPNMLSLLPRESFPCSSIYGNDSIILSSLRDLGMKTQLSCGGVLIAAEAIHNAFAARNKTKASNYVDENKCDVDAYESALVRSRELLKYLDNNAETLISECDAMFLKSWVRQNGSGLDNRNVTRAMTTRPPERMDSDDEYIEAPVMKSESTGYHGCAWGEKMRSLNWIPVLNKTSLTAAISAGGSVLNPWDRYLPWPDSLHQHPLSNAVASVLPQNRWLCSSTYRILVHDVASSLLRNVMGWDRPIPGNAIAQQLLVLVETYIASAGSRDGSKNNPVFDHYYTIVPRLYEALTASMMHEEMKYVEIWMRALRNKPVIWIGSQFIEPSRIAFQGLSSVDTEPFLYTVKGELLSHTEFLKGLGVRSSFDVCDIAGILREMHKQYEVVPLLEAQFDMCVGLVNILIRLTRARAVELRGEPDALPPVPPREEKNIESSDAMINSVLVEKVNDSSEENSNIDDSDNALAADTNWKLALSELGIIYIPDANNILAPSQNLCYDDAAWISSMFQRRGAVSSQSKVQFRFVNRKIDNETAKLLGCKSLREQLFTGDDVVCPSVHSLQALLNGDNCVDAISDICGIADELKADGVHVLIDCESYPCESLIHPGLMESQQNPSLLVYFDGVKFDSEVLSRMFTSTQDVPTLPYSCRIDAGPQKRPSVAASSVEAEYNCPRYGKRLASSFVFTDCLQILSGDYLYIYDPCGKYIFGSGSHSQSAGGATGSKGLIQNECHRAQRCKLTGQEGHDFMVGFPDQIAPFVNLRFGHHSPVWNEGKLRGTILRMPLRTSKSEVFPIIHAESTIFELVRNRFRTILEGLLLFGAFVKRGSSFTIPKATDRNELLLTSLELTSASASKFSVRQFLLDTSWKKASGMLGFSMFKSYTPTEDDYRVAIYVRERNFMDEASCLGELSSINFQNSVVSDAQEEWLVLMSLGQSRLRDLANRSPYFDLNLQPFVSIAARISLSEATVDPSIPPRPSYFYSGGQAMEFSGLPFHTNSFFLQDVGLRGLPLPVLAGNISTSLSRSIAQPHGHGGKAANRLSLSFVYEWNAAVISTAIDCLGPKCLVEVLCLFANQSKHAPKNSSSPSKSILSLYRYWPFLPRMKPYLASTVRSVKLLPALSTKSLFVCQNEFFTIDRLLLSHSDFPKQVMQYLQSFVKISEIPPQIVKDLIECEVRFSTLSPAKLREIMKGGRSQHISKLKAQYHILIPLLQYVLSDLERFSTHGDSVRRNSYREVAGCPLLPMSDGSVRAFPSQSREVAVFLAPSLHYLLPHLRHLMIHLVALKKIPIFEDKLFRESLFIGKLSLSFLQENLVRIIPPIWRNCQFIDRDYNSTGVNSTYGTAYSATNTSRVGTVGTERVASLSTANLSPSSEKEQHTLEPPSDLLVYVLWKELLDSASGSRLMALADGIKEWPLLPVVVGPSRSKRLFASPYLLQLLLLAPHNDQEDAKRAGLVLEDIRLSNEVLAASSLPEDLSAVDATIATSLDFDSYVQPDWSWCSTDYEVLKSREQFLNCSIDSKMVSAQVGPTSASSAVSDVINSQPIADASSGSRLDADLNTFSLSPPLVAAFENLHLPLLDGSIFEDLPHRPPTSVNGVNISSLGRNILVLLHALHVQGSFVHECKLLMSGSGSYQTELADEPYRLLKFETLTIDDRRTILLEIFNAHITQPLRSHELDMLKSLPLFTSKDGLLFSIVQYSTVYWVANASVLEGLSTPSHSMGITSSTPSTTGIGSSAIILYVDPSLQELYHLIGAEQLTPAVAVRRFTLPALNEMVGRRRTEIMKGVAEHWGKYRDDADLVRTLAAVPFVPSWHIETVATGTAAASSQIKESEFEDFEVPLRCPNQLFSWTNGDLINALQGPALPLYFAPSSFRNSTWHVMMTDLGMAGDIDKESMIRLSSDIQESIERDTSDQAKKSAADRGRRLLHYALDDNRLFFDTDLARRLGKIRFVPVDWPAAIESGGHVKYVLQICRFDQTIAAVVGSLAFTVVPVLPKDCSPPQNFYSSLGIMASPPVDIVLKHLKNLTHYAGDSLDRWNNPHFPLIQTFSAIYSYLYERWRDIPVSMKDVLRITNIVPIGHHLARPSRVFFRLSEDLSPFMHELPRVFGAHETFLKEVGIRERPSADDYVKFLAELSSECNGEALNPNELKAAIAIIQAIVAPPEFILNDISGPIYVPDERGILRDSRCVLFNDSGWLRTRLDTNAINDEFGIFIVHPLMSKFVTIQLGIQTLASVFVEHLATGFGPVGIMNEHEVAEPFANILKSKEFSDAILLVNSNKGQSWSAHQRGDGDSGIESMLAKIEIRFLTDLKVKLVLASINQNSTLSQRITDPRAVTVQDNMSSYCFVEDALSASGKITIFINYCDIMDAGSVLTLEMAISLGLCNILSLDPSLCNLVSTLLSTGVKKGYRGIRQVLSDLRIGRDSHTDLELSRGVPGAPVVRADQRLLELKPFRSYRLGEVVACANTVISSITVSSSITEAYVYAIVAEIGEIGDGGIRKVAVRVGEGNNSMRSLLTTEIYSFRSAREYSAAACKTVKAELLAGKSTGSPASIIGKIAVVKDPVRDNHASLRNVTVSEKHEEAIDVIRKSDVISALHGLLHRAGVPISLENEELVSKIVSLNSVKELLEDELQTERAHAEELRLASAKSTDAMRCQICITNQISNVLVPCGHTICGDCAGQIPRNKCPFCRTVIREKVKFFVGQSL